jgi:glutathione peroxidase
MKKAIYMMGIISFLSSCFVSKSKKVEPAKEGAPASSIYDIRIKTLDGTSEIKLSDYKGKYLVIVNTASECGYTYQYKDLQEFYTRFRDSNVMVMGCPCNQFGEQEPGTVAEIGSFCQKNYGVTFPLTEKIEVKGPNQHPLYQWLTQKQKNGVGDYEVKWNFYKFIINPEGKVVQFFGSKVKPGDSAFVASVRK